MSSEINDSWYYTTSEAQAWINHALAGAYAFTRARVTLECAEGDIPASKVGGRWKILGRDLKAYLKKLGASNG